MDHQVWAVWQYLDGSWYGNAIQDLLIVDEIPEDRGRTKGSGTPFYKIRKTSLKPLDDLINKREQPRLF